MNELELDVQKVHAMRQAGDPFLLLDCREPFEFETAAIEGATLIPMHEIPGRLAEIEPHSDGHVVVMCHHGVRSLQVTLALRQAGFAKAYSMAGGIDAWSQQIDPSVPKY